jgi:hypothetical protein
MACRSFLVDGIWFVSHPIHYNSSIININKCLTLCSFAD